MLLPHAWIMPLFLIGMVPVDFPTALIVAFVVSLFLISFNASYVGRNYADGFPNDRFEAMVWFQIITSCLGILFILGSCARERRNSETYKI